jgi:SAM-dependent methyltransferase
MTKDALPEERWSFDKVPEIYDRVRPTYPAQLFDDMFAYVRASLPEAEPCAVEIGPGTGQATGSLLDRGARVTAVELGPNLAKFLRDKFASEDRLDVVNSPFEEAVLPSSSFDLVFSATAFHWIDPAVRMAKAHGLLRPGGVLAVVSTNQIRSDADRGFFDRAMPIYKKYYGEEKRQPVPGEDVVPNEYHEMAACGLFKDVELHRYRWDQTYSTSAYADLVRSYGNTGTLDPPAREALIADLSALIDAEFGGSVVRPLVITLTLGRRGSP